MKSKGKSKLVLTLFVLFVLVFPLRGFSQKAVPAKANVAEITVSLFGEPCFLSGPFDSDTLKAIHAISPEKNPPVQSAEQSRQLLERLKKSPALPSGLDLYREKLAKHLEGQVAYFDSLAEAKRTKKIDKFFAGTKAHVNPSKRKAFEGFVRKLDSKENVSTWSFAVLQQVEEVYSEISEPRPEEEFHRATRKLKVHYNCSFGEYE